MDQGEQLSREVSFISLQVTDQMPVYWSCYVIDFLLRLLDIILTDVGGACGKRRLYCVGAFRLCSADNGNCLGCTTAAMGYFGNMILYATIIRSDINHEGADSLRG